MTEAGEIRLDAWLEADPASEAGSIWGIPRLREELVRHALAALHLFKRGEHYLVRDGKILIVDEFTGRAMPDRQWTDGLHQMIERKEGCAPTRRRVTLARLTFQRFFPRYRRLSGMTGTAAEVAGELWAVYGLPVHRIPTHRQVRRASAARSRRGQLGGEMERRRGGGRRVEPRGPADADRNPHRRGLVARQRRADRARLAPRGVERRSGRGGSGDHCARRRAGPHHGRDQHGGARRRHPDFGGNRRARRARGVHHRAPRGGRIDRQLAGRAARQGDPGSVAAILALDDPLLAMAGAPIRLLARFCRALPVGAVRDAIAAFAFRRAQRGLERAHAAARLALLRGDRSRAEQLGFAGIGE